MNFRFAHTVVQTSNQTTIFFSGSFFIFNHCQQLWGWGCLLPNGVGHCQLSLFIYYLVILLSKFLDEIKTANDMYAATI